MIRILLNACGTLSANRPEQNGVRKLRSYHGANWKLASRMSAISAAILDCYVFRSRRLAEMIDVTRSSPYKCTWKGTIKKVISKNDFIENVINNNHGCGRSLPQPLYNSSLSPEKIAPLCLGFSAFSVILRIIVCAKSVLTAQVANTRTTVNRKVVATNSTPARKTTLWCAGTTMNPIRSASEYGDRSQSRTNL
jgi:hypothetical protein